MDARLLTISLCGDVMLGRAVDQILPNPVDPALREPVIHDARLYAQAAENLNGAIPSPVDFRWPWGDALGVLDDLTPDVRLLNLECSVTHSEEWWPDKYAYFRMSPENLPCLSAVRPDVCTLANNHVLDFGRSGLDETLTVLERAGIETCGAGRDAEAARRPAVVEVGQGGRVLVFALGMDFSGIPESWAAGESVSGVAYAADEDSEHIVEILEQIRQLRRAGDIVVVSLHSGPNWGYGVPNSEVRLAHMLIDGGVDLIFSHSSHHARPIEIYRGRVIFYGCGDFINDYEGITIDAMYRHDLRPMYFVSLEADTGCVADVRIVPFQSRKLRLERASFADAQWLQETLQRHSAPFDTLLKIEADGAIRVMVNPG